MKKKALLVCVSLLLAVSFVAIGCAAPAPAPAPEALPEVALGGTLEKIDRTGKLTVGAREGAIPFGFYDEKGEWVGYSMDLAREVVLPKVEEVLGKDIELEFMPVTGKTRIPMIVAGTVDMVAGITTHTRARDDVVDYSVTFFPDGTRMLVPKDSPIREWEDLAGKRVGCVLGTMDEKNLTKLNEHLSPLIEIKTYEKHTIGFLALKDGKTEAHVTDASVLAGLAAKAPDPENWEVRGIFLAYSPLASIMRENDSDFRDLVNFAIIEAIEDGRLYEIYDRWFGPRGVVPFPMSEEVKAYFRLICWP